jgi:signal transduction histidine kinase
MTNRTMRHRAERSSLWPWVLLLLFVWGGVSPVARAVDTLTNASDVLALTAERASNGIPIVVKGVVTAAETNWNGRFFVQDSSGGIFVENKSPRQPEVGDVVEVSGVSHPGGYAPIITKPHWETVGTAPLPPAKPVTIERLMSGSEDSQRVEISGIVRTAQFSGSRIGIELASGGYRFRAFFPIPPSIDPQSLVGANVMLRGTAATSFNAPLRHFLTVTLYMPRLEDFVVKEPAPPNLFDGPLIPLNSIAQYRKDSSPGNQVHVKGVVTYQRKGEDLFLQDATGGLQVKSKLMETVYPGDVVEAAGFPAVKNFLPVLEDAVFRKTGEPPGALQPKPATVGEMQKGLHQSDYVILQGRLLERLVRGTGQSVDGPDVQTVLVLQATNFIFEAEKHTPTPNKFLTGIPIGSLLEVSGVCLLENGDDARIKSFRLLLPTSHDVRIIEEPSWFTRDHLVASLGVVLVVLLGAMGWTVLVAKRNLILKSLVQEKETAQAELQEAHDQLEERIKERTAQLKVEMTARKESELQFRAVLTERTRLAQELHDTLEQTMTGIALQLDVVATRFERNPESASHHLKVARSLMKQSQVDLRRSVWGLRSRADEEFNLTNALITSGRQITDDTGMGMEVETAGEAYPLPEIVEESLLRIGQEAITNAVKHSGASLVKLELRFSPQEVALEIRDNGKGFDPGACAGPKDGHFGLLGIRERTERLGGQVSITSALGTGASVRVDIPTGESNGDQAPQPQAEDHEERV